MSINRVMISGRITRDPELRSAGGASVLTFGVAVNDRKKNQQTGEWEDVPNFVECVLWGKRAESLSRFLSKGTKVAVEGKLRYSAWEKDGVKRSKLEVVVDELELMSGQQQGQRQAPPQAPQAPQRTYYPNQAPGGYQEQPQYDLSRDLYDGEEIPF